MCLYFRAVAEIVIRQGPEREVERARAFRFVSSFFSNSSDTVWAEAEALMEKEAAQIIATLLALGEVAASNGHAAYRA